jgi:hypothetical protein
MANGNIWWAFWIFYDHLFGTFWNHVPRTIWQPWKHGVRQIICHKSFQRSIHRQTEGWFLNSIPGNEAGPHPDRAPGFNSNDKYPSPNGFQFWADFLHYLIKFWASILLKKHPGPKSHRSPEPKIFRPNPVLIHFVSKQDRLVNPKTTWLYVTLKLNRSKGVTVDPIEI